MKLPILPGFIIDSEVVSDLEKTDLQADLKSAMAKIEKIVGKKFGDPANPMLVKIVISPNMVIVNYPTLHNFGLCHKNLAAFNTYVGENFGHHEMQFLMKGTLEIEAKIAELEKRSKDFKAIQDAIKELNKELHQDLDGQARAKSIARLQSLMPKGFFNDPYTQLEIALKRIARMFKLDDIDDSDTALLIQPMVYGNYGKDSASGQFYTRDIVTGEKRLTGSFYQESFNEIGANKKDINSIQPAYMKLLENVAKKIEDHFKEIRSVRFTIENKRLWLIDQLAVMNKSTQSDIQLLLDLYARKVVDREHVIRQIKPNQLSELLHPVIDLSSAPAGAPSP